MEALVELADYWLVFLGGFTTMVLRHKIWVKHDENSALVRILLQLKPVINTNSSTIILTFVGDISVVLFR